MKFSLRSGWWGQHPRSQQFRLTTAKYIRDTDIKVLTLPLEDRLLVLSPSQSLKKASQSIAQDRHLPRPVDSQPPLETAPLSHHSIHPVLQNGWHLQIDHNHRHDLEQIRQLVDHRTKFTQLTTNDDYNQLTTSNSISWSHSEFTQKELTDERSKSQITAVMENCLCDHTRNEDNDEINRCNEVSTQRDRFKVNHLVRHQ